MHVKAERAPGPVRLDSRMVETGSKEKPARVKVRDPLKIPLGDEANVRLRGRAPAFRPIMFRRRCRDNALQKMLSAICFLFVETSSESIFDACLGAISGTTRRT